LQDNLATLLNDFRLYNRQIAVVRYQGNRRRETTYGELAHLAGRFAALLAQRGIGPGDRVLLWAENSAEWIAAFHGCILRGVLAVPLDAAGSADFASRVAVDTSPKLAVGDAPLLEQLAGEWPQLAFEQWLSVLPAEEAGPIPELSADTPLQILFTSGTTGDPKGVVLTHGNVLASVGPIRNGAQPYMRYEKIIHPLRILHTLPLSHVFGQTMGLWVPPIFAAELHIETRPVASRLIQTIHRERISVLAAVPRVLALLKTHLEATYPGLTDQVAASTGIGALRRWIRFRRVHTAFGLKFWALISGGGALPGPLEHFWSALGFVLVQGYGMTETTALITLNHPFHVAKGTIGKPLPGREVKLGPDGEVLVRGASIAAATWSGGVLHPRQSEWLATGDLAQTEPSGELRFLGRKSDVIVTASGVNVYPEDLEQAVEQEPGVTACAVMSVDTEMGPEPFAVLAFRGPEEHAAIAIEHANARLASYQRLRHWALWPELDLPRTSTGKVRRKPIEAWLEQLYSATATAGTGTSHPVDMGAFGASADWLLALIAQISGETQHRVGDELRLTEDLHLDSLGRVQLAAAIEERLGITTENGLFDQVQTLGDLRQLLAAEPEEEALPNNARVVDRTPSSVAAETAATAQPEPSAPGKYTYPHWPWLKPFQWLRVAFVEALMRPLVCLLANPRVVASPGLNPAEPMLIVANHVTAYDVPFLQYALPGPIRQHIAVAMSGEMLQAYRHFRNPEPLHPTGKFFLPGPLFYLLMTALFNVFPLPRRRDFQLSFAHAGEALDHGFNVLVFPEGSRSTAGELAPFRPGIGLLAKQSGAAVLPMAIRGLGQLKAGDQRWFRSGTVEVVIGQPLRFSPEDTEATITSRLHAEVERLLQN
jgi:long-chain acyl-CoA synthetase